MIPRSWMALTLWLLAAGTGLPATLDLHTRARTRTGPGTNDWQVTPGTNHWDASRTAIVICDMWDKHHCPDATERVGEMASRMNEMIRAARQQGCLIIHCPSDTMDFYKDHPGRKLAQAAPKVDTKIPLEGWCSLKPDHEAPLPIDDSDGGCDGCPDCPSYKAWTRQHPALEILPGDAITDSAEAYYLMHQRGITNVVVMGVHINMCVLGRPFSIRQMVRQGQNVVLVRDLTDSMYNHRKWPFVSHFRGTGLVVEHIEKYWCPSITSSDFLGGEPFRFHGDRPKHVVMVVGENEYHTWETLPAFAREQLEPRGYRVSLVQASPQEGDSDFHNWEAIRDADLVLLSVRRRTTPPGMMEALHAHLAAGKPLVGIRTASHAFELRGQPNPPGKSWVHFDHDILGADYEDHYGAGRATVVRQIPETAGNPILTGVAAEFRAESHLYKSRNLLNTVTPLLNGRTEDGKSEVEPVAWINTRENHRIFYTSLGSPADFAEPNFRRLLVNGVLWALDDFIPPAPTPSPAPKATPPSATAPAATPAAAPAVSPSSPEQLGPLTPAESARSFQVADDLVWEQVLAEPIVQQPVFLTFDERGRMWVVQYRQYPHPAGLKMVSRDNFWRAVYDRVPPPPPHHFPGLDRITIHEDTDGDGIFDKHKTFIDGLSIATSVAFGRGGVFVLNPPYLLFYADRNRDDVPDGDPEVLLSGFGLEDTHSVANSLRWGPDGWLYGCQGSTVTGNIVVYGADGKPLGAKPAYSQGQNIWRYHPEKRLYEVFSEGGGNAFGLEIDSAGRIFSGHNGGNTRGFHYQQGAYLQKGFEKHGPLSNPYAFGYFPQMPHNDVDRFTHNFLVYDSGALGERYEGRLFGVEPLQGRIVLSEITPMGSTFRTRDLGHPVTSTDKWFRPVDIKLGPDGAIYVCDWYDRQVNHYRNNEGQMDPANGRIYRLRAKSAKPVPGRDLAALSTPELVARLSHANRWQREQALRLIADRHDPASVAALSLPLRQDSGPMTPEALWALHVSGGLTDDLAAAALRHGVPVVREWAVRLLGDPRHVTPALASQLAELAARESDIDVRAQLACTARRLPADQGLPIVHQLLSHDRDAGDSRQPLLLWWAIEEHCASESAAVLDLFRDRELWHAPIVHTHLLSRLMRRFAATGRREDLMTAAKLFALSPGPDQTARLTQGFEEAFQGRPLVGLPEELVAAMEKAGGESVLIGVRRGRPDAIRRALTVVADPKVPAAQRIQLVQVLGETRPEGALPALLTLVRTAKEQPLRRAALGALQGFDRPEVAGEILAQYPSYEGEVRDSALALLGTRANWAGQLLGAIEDGRIPKAGVPRDLVRRIKAFRDSGLDTRTARLWPEVRQAASAELDHEIARLGELVNAATGSPYVGKKLFLETCGTCHRLFGKGGEVGPDLTVYKRDDLPNLLLNIVNPNAEIREGYENMAVETRDGRMLSGFITDRDEQVVILRTADGQSVALPRAEIASLQAAGGSLMPEGLLAALGDQQIRDLFAYLRSTQPLNDGN